MYIQPLWYVTGVTTVLSGLGYIDGSGLKKIVKGTKNRIKNMDRDSDEK